MFNGLNLNLCTENIEFNQYEPIPNRINRKKNNILKTVSDSKAYNVGNKSSTIIYDQCLTFKTKKDVYKIKTLNCCQD